MPRPPNWTRLLRATLRATLIALDVLRLRFGRLAVHEAQRVSPETREFGQAVFHGAAARPPLGRHEHDATPHGGGPRPPAAGAHGADRGGRGGGPRPPPPRQTWPPRRSPRRPTATRGSPGTC